MSRSRSAGAAAARWSPCATSARTAPRPCRRGAFFAEADGAETVECPYHGWRFGADGACRAIPSLIAAQAFETSRIGVRRYPVVESQGMVFVWVAADPRDDAAPLAPPPTFPGVVGGAPKLVDRLDVEAHIDHAVVGLMDPAHGPYVHRQWWWRSRASSHEKAKRFEPSPEGFVMVRHPPSRNSRAYALLGGRPLTEITFRLPGFRWEHVTVGKRQVLALTCLTPLTEAKTRITQMVWSDHPIFALAGPLIGLAARRFLGQDADMVDLPEPGPEIRSHPPLDRRRRPPGQMVPGAEAGMGGEPARGPPFANPVEPATLAWTS